MSRISITPRKLRLLLVATLVLLFVGAVGGFIYAQNQLQSFAASTIQLETDAKANNNSIGTLKQLGSKLEEYQDVKEKAEAITVDKSKYPVSVINTINQLAKQSGVTLTNVSYGKDDSSATSGGATTSQPGTTPTPTTPMTEPTAPGAVPGASTPALSNTATPNGVIKKTIDVTVASPVEYEPFMNFLARLESNNMFLHIPKLSIAKESGTSITVQPLTVEVYVKQ